MSKDWESKFIGRENELGLLQKGLKKAKKGFGNILFITGEAGVGKTRLALELSKNKDSSDFEFLMGQCIYRDGTDPYLPFIDMFKEYLSDHPYMARAIQASLNTPGSLIFDFYRFDEKRYDKKIPVQGLDNFDENGKHINGPYNEMNEDFVISTDLEDESSELFQQQLLDGKQRMFETISKLIIGIAQKKTLVLFIDDVHWADEASLHLLHYLARNIRNQSILILCAYRTEEIGLTHEKVDPLSIFISRLGSENLFSTVNLHRLDQNETLEIISDLLAVNDVPEDFTDLIYHETEGNPFFIKEVLKTLIEDGSLKIENNKLVLTISPEEIVIPISIQELINLRLKRLDMVSADILEYASVIGNEFQFDLLNNITDIVDSKLINILAKLSDIKIIEEINDGPGFKWQFTHNKIHEVIYNNLTDNKKRLIHLRLAKYLEDTRIDHLDEVVYDLAYHFYKGVDFDRALSYSIEGGEKAMRAFAYKEALDFYRISLDSLRLLNEKLANTTHYKEKKVDVLSRLGTLNRIMGDTEKALNYFEQILPICDEISYIQRKAKTYLEIGRIYEKKKYFKEAKRFFQKSLGLSKRMNNDFITCEAYQGLGILTEHEGKFQDAMEYYLKSLKYAEANHDSINLAKLHSAFGRIYSFKGNHKKALEHKKISVSIFEGTKNLPELAKAYNSIGLTYLNLGNIEKNIEFNDKCIDLADRISDIRIKGLGLATTIEGLIESNDLDKALEYATDAFEIFKKLEDREMIALSFMNFGIIFEKKGEWDPAIDNFKSAIELLESMKQTYYIAECYSHFANIFENKGEDAKAKYYKKKAKEIFDQSSITSNIDNIMCRTQNFCAYYF